MQGEFGGRFRCASVLLVVCLQVGCSSERGRKKKIRKVQGVAKLVDVENRVVSMTFTDDKDNERELVGTFTDETIVLINGRAHDLKDIHPGDKVLVYGYRVGDGPEPMLVATKVVVDRPKNSDWKTAGPRTSGEPSGSKDRPDSRVSAGPLGGG